MNINMNRQATDRGFGMGIEKPSSKPVNTKRRALGDITNSVADDESKVAQNKTPVFVARPSVQEMQIAESKDDYDMMDRPYMQRAVDDIDGRDIDNPLLCTDYVNQMYGHFGVLEREFAVKCNYMAKQDFVNEKMRCILADWLVRTISFDLSVNRHNGQFFLLLRSRSTSSSRWSPNLFI